MSSDRNMDELRDWPYFEFLHLEDMVLFNCNSGMVITLMVTVIAYYDGMLVSALTINSTVPAGEHVCPEQDITFTCETRGSPTIAWASFDYIDVGSQLEFAVFNHLGDKRISPINPNTVATLVGSSINDDGEQILVSELHLMASSQFPTFSISCIHGNGTESTITIFVQDEPYMPQNVTVNQRIEEYTERSGCTIYLGWNPPTNIAQDDVSHYIIYINGTKFYSMMTNINRNLILIAFPVCICASHQITVSAVDRCGREGQRSPNITPVPDQFMFPFECRIPQSTNSETVAGSTVLIVVVLVVVVVMSIILMTVVMVSVIVIGVYCKKYVRNMNKY